MQFLQFNRISQNLDINPSTYGSDSTAFIETHYSRVFELTEVLHVTCGIKLKKKSKVSGENSWLCPHFLVIRSLRTHSSLPQWNHLLFILTFTSTPSWIAPSWSSGFPGRKRTQNIACEVMWPWNDSTVNAIIRSIVYRNHGTSRGKVKGPFTSSSSSITGRALWREKTQGGGSECIHMVQTRVSLSINSICFWSDLPLIRYRKLH